MTTTQLEIDLGSLVLPEPRLSTEERFAQFHRDNPHVLDALVQLIEADRAQGFSYCSIKYHWETLRRSGVRTTGRPWKLDNSYTGLYARLITDQRPDLAPLLRLRDRSAA